MEDETNGRSEKMREGLFMVFYPCGYEGFPRDAEMPQDD
jgi:hypothetical protein